MSLFDKVLKNIEEKKKHKESGNHNMIPFCFPRYKEYFDGFSPGDYIGLLGSTGSGKSRLVRHWMYSMVDFVMKTTYKAKILYFSLEDPEIPVGLKIMSHYLFVRHNISVSAKMLASRDHPLADKYLDLIRSDRVFWNKFDSIVEVINGLTSPNQIRDKVRQSYKDNPGTHIIVLIDNQSNVTTDPGDANEWEAIKRLSRDVIRLGFCPAGITTITVLQLDFDSERNTFRNVGKGGLVNIEPNLASIGDAKVVARAMHVVLAIFDPWRFEIEKYPNAQGYDIGIMRNRFKALLMLKSNEGAIAPRFGMRFDGLHEIYSEMPIYTDKEGLDKIYKEVLLEERQRIERIAQKLW